jgi:hypothetical protein
MEEVASTIVYDDEHIRVIWQPGDSKYLMITFGDLVTNVDGTRFTADRPISSARLACIGFVAKGPNWYPFRAMTKALGVVAQQMAPYEERVLYGSSMGGYAAFKYSKALGATTVIALCPQWSIDRSECDGFNPGWEQFFEDQMRGMGVRSDDVTGRTFIFADMAFPVDHYHAQQLVGAAPTTTVVNVPATGHNVTSTLAGTSNLISVIAGCRHHDTASLRHVVRAARRHKAFRINHILRRLIERKPASALGLVTQRFDSKAWVRLIEPLILYRLIVTASSFQGRPLGLITSSLLTPLLVDPVLRMLALLMTLTPNVDGAVGLKTSHSTFIVFEIEWGECVHRSLLGGRKTLPVRLHIIGSKMRFFIEVAGCRVDLALNSTGTLVVSWTKGSCLESEVEIVCGSKSSLCFRAAGGFLSAEKTGRLVFNRAKPSTWEEFDLAELRHSEHDTRSLDTRNS